MASYQNGRTQTGTCRPSYRFCCPHNIWNGVHTISEILFVNIAFLFWQGLKGIWKIFDQMVDAIFDILWFLGKFLVLDVLSFIPGQLLEWIS
ncbi:hypothetical protein DL96DRAFT_1624525 [Flagelloscypha sp. PMI_526]|nr:hypothetical protein DL96DRAFT_1624525 [Flagelloscypha sp. PMI_526]